MKPFEYHRASDAAGARQALTGRAKFLAGGTNLIDLMKNGVEQPEKLVDLKRAGLETIERLPDGGLRLGAMARNSDTANHPEVRQKYPLLAKAILSGASAQLRNLATNGGNVMQRTRCPYFMDPGFAQCNKRSPGSGCGAREGFNRVHAIFGASEQCIAVHPSDMSVALAALEASVRVQGRGGERRIPFAEFHRLPGTTPEMDTNLKADELILSIDLPAPVYAEHSSYVKVRDRMSYEFALVSAAVGLQIAGGVIRSARIALGGVAHKPWRVEAAERVLMGKAASSEVFAAAGREAVAGAKGYRENEFKIRLAERAVVRALEIAGGVA